MFVESTSTLPLVLPLSPSTASTSSLSGWAAGGLEIFVRNNALFKKGLKPAQCFLYFWAGFNTCFLYFWAGFNTVLSLAMFFLIHCPLVYLLFQGIFQIATFDSKEYFMAFMPYMCLQIVCMNISYKGCPKDYILKSLRESVFTLYCYARAVLTVFFGIKLGFKVTSKDGEASEFRKSFNC
jgi:cellulose synthase/poly-beta-1,6-N-acetylglucosamine synthase-like glycosyltransferase